jgi:hypothetical protein
VSPLIRITRCSIDQSMGLTFLSMPSDDEAVVFFRCIPHPFFYPDPNTFR